MALNPQGTRVAMGTANDRRATLLLWDIGQQPPKAIHMETYKNIVTNVAFSPDGNTLAVGTGHAAADQPGGQRVLQRAPVNPAPASSGAAGEVHLWDVQAWRRISGAFASGHEYPIEAVAFSRDGKTLLVGVPHPMPIFWPLEHSAWDAVGCALKRGEEPCGTKPTPRKNDGLNASSEPARVQGPQ
jgi:WD40 repeat protein